MNKIVSIYTSLHLRYIPVFVCCASLVPYELVYHPYKFECRQGTWFSEH